jgi:ribonuclease P protein component
VKKINRVTSNQDFATAIKKGRTLRCNSFALHVFKNELGYGRIGISVSTKLGHAVVRNRVKRQIRAMCDSLINYENSEYDIIIIAKNNFLESSYQTNYEELRELLKNLELIK